MPTAARPADVIEALVERAQTEGAVTLEQLRTTFEKAGIGPGEAGEVLRRLTEAGVVSLPGGEETAVKKPRKRAATARPVKKAAPKAATRPAGRTVVDAPADAAAPAVEETVAVAAPAVEAPAVPATPVPVVEFDEGEHDAPAKPVAEEDKPLAIDEPPPGIDLVKAYLREIGKVALLTAVEEVE
ncbi:MAG: polymerase sigma factor, partial [Frankiales bacterium]|nr:polymerase sigma factor [Frankiales bacterium]